MERGILISASGMESMLARQDIIANNLANASTSGYKSDVASLKSFPSVFARTFGELRGGVKVDSIGQNFGQGPLVETGNRLDVALQGEGFFVVETPNGQKYTRNGALFLDAAGQLVTANGFPIAGDGGPIVVNGSEITINGAGEVIVDGARVNKLMIVDFDKPYDLRKIGNSLFEPASAAAAPMENPENVSVIQGSLEGSGLSVVTEMVYMIETMRLYETNQKALLTQDEMMQKASTQVGRTQ